MPVKTKGVIWSVVGSLGMSVIGAMITPGISLLYGVLLFLMLLLPAYVMWLYRISPHRKRDFSQVSDLWQNDTETELEQKVDRGYLLISSTAFLLAIIAICWISLRS